MAKPEPIDLKNSTIDDLKGRDLSPAVIARAKAAKKTWFVERTGFPNQGQIIAVEEKEAWDMLYNTSTWKRRDFRFIGHSDGKTYKKVVEESMGMAHKLLPEIESTRAEVEKYRNIEGKLMVDEIVDMDGDPSDEANELNKNKVLRLRKIITKHENKLEELEKDYSNHTANVIHRATDAELEVARANWAEKKVWPGAVNMITPHVDSGERLRILGAMGQNGMQ